MKKTLCLLLILVLTMGLTATFSFADNIGNGDASTYSTAGVAFYTKRVSNTKAIVSVDVVFTKKADDYVVAIVLQKKPVQVGLLQLIFPTVCIIIEALTAQAF